jgi:hypothetical protein
VTFTLLASTALLSDYLGEKLPSFAPLNEILGKQSLKIVFGFLVAIVGIMKFIIRAPNDSIAVVGDFLPAIVGIGIGLALLTDFFKKNIEASKEVIEKAEKITVTYRIPLGILGIVTSILHFLFPATVIL